MQILFHRFYILVPQNLKYCAFNDNVQVLQLSISSLQLQACSIFFVKFYVTDASLQRRKKSLISKHKNVVLQYHSSIITLPMNRIKTFSVSQDSRKAKDHRKAKLN